MPKNKEITWEPLAGLIGSGIGIVSAIAEFFLQNPDLGLGMIAGALINGIAVISIANKTKKP